MKHIVLIAALLAIGGCKIEGAAGVKADRIANLKEASARAAAHADSVTGAVRDTVINGQGWHISPAAQNGEFGKVEVWYRDGSVNTSAGTARVAKALAAADITLPQIAAYLAERGWTVRQAAPPMWHWTPAPPGTYPVAYYTWRMVGAVGDTSLVHDIPQAVGPYRLEVRAIDTHQNVGTWSIVGWSDGGDGNNALPGVGE